jgi:Zn-finger nucleic acid-binding protein
MLYIKKNCPICRYGTVGFRRCSDGETIFLMCDECDSVWLNPQEVDSNHALYPSPPDFLVPTLGCSAMKSLSQWASDEDVTKKGWMSYVAGKGKALDET